MTKQYDPFVTLKKGFFIGLLALISAMITYLSGLPPEQQVPVIVIVLSLLKMAENYLKHNVLKDKEKE